jgi:transposase
LCNRIHRLLGTQHEVKLPQCCDLFGRKDLSFLEKLELPAPTRLLLTQQLALFKELAVRVHEDEKALESLLQESPALNYVRSLPGMGPILAAVVVSEIDGVERFGELASGCGRCECHAGQICVGDGSGAFAITTLTVKKVGEIALDRIRSPSNLNKVVHACL